MFLSYFNIGNIVSAQQRISRRRSESPAPSKLLQTPETSRRPSNTSLENQTPEEHSQDIDGTMTDQEDQEDADLDDSDPDINVED